MSVSVSFARFERPSTGSFLTVQLPAGIHDDQVGEFAAKFFPGWEVILTSQENPDIRKGS